MSEDVTPAGWWLGLPYMQGEGLRAAAPGEIPAGAPRDFLFVGDVLGLCPDWRQSLRAWWAHLRPGGHLVLWLKDCARQNVDGYRFTLESVDHALDGVAGWEQLECEARDGHLFAVYRKVAENGNGFPSPIPSPPALFELRRTSDPEGPAGALAKAAQREGGHETRRPWRKAAKHALVIRSGAYGDALMAASLFPHLREEGWTLDLLTSAAGEEALRHDPHLARILVLGRRQVEDADLPHYWQAHAGRYDRVINLTFSVEGELLKQPFRGDYYWSDAQRRALCNRSYLRRIAALGGVNKPLRVRFYPTPEEKEFARRARAEFGPFILWSLKGSAVHKWWPHAPKALCRILALRHARIVLTGGEDARELAGQAVQAVRDYFGPTERLVNLTATHSMREVFALAQEAALVVGPETGVLAAASFEAMPKLVFLSHSSPVNLTDDWINATAIRPKAACHPCHRLHYGHQWCPRDEATGAAACAAGIPVDEVVEQVIRKGSKGSQGSGGSKKDSHDPFDPPDPYDPFKRHIA